MTRFGGHSVWWRPTFIERVEVMNLNNIICMWDNPASLTHMQFDIFQPFRGRILIPNLNNIRRGLPHCMPRFYDGVILRVIEAQPMTTSLLSALPSARGRIGFELKCYRNFANIISNWDQLTKPDALYPWDPIVLHPPPPLPLYHPLYWCKGGWVLHECSTLKSSGEKVALRYRINCVTLR
jgi:hypothetical protein